MGFFEYWLYFGLYVTFVFHLLVVGLASVFRVTLFKLRVGIKSRVESFLWPFIYWGALIASSFFAFQSLGISFSANPNLYVVEIENTGVAERVKEIGSELNSIQGSLGNPESLTLKEINQIGLKITSITRSVGDQISEMSYLISDAEKKSVEARRKVEEAQTTLERALLEKDQQIASYKEQIETIKALSEAEKKVIAEALLTDVKKENSKSLVSGNAISFVLGIIASLIAAHFYPLLLRYASLLGKKTK